MLASWILHRLRFATKGFSRLETPDGDNTWMVLKLADLRFSDGLGKAIDVEGALRVPEKFLARFDKTGISIPGVSRIQQVLAALWAMRTGSSLLYALDSSGFIPTLLNDTTRRFKKELDCGLFWFQSSGSTGQSKYVLHSSKNLQQSSILLAQAHPSLTSGRVINWFPTRYMAGILNGVIFPLTVGAEAFIAPEFTFASPRQLHKFLKSGHPNHVWVSPNMLSSLLVGSSAETLAKVDTIINATGGISQKQFESAKKKGIRELINSYGSTELLFHSSSSGSKQWEGVGRALQGIDISFSEQNAIQITSPTAALCLVDGSGQEEIALPQPLITSDSGKTISGGNLSITGRLDDYVSIGGLQENLRTIEEVAESAEGVIVAVLRYEELITHRDLTLIIEAETADSRKLEGRLRELIAETLGPNRVPGKIIFETVERLPSGKPRRNRAGRDTL